MKKFRDIVKAPHEQIKFPTSQYERIEYEKKQVVLHHTASGSGAYNDIAFWESDKKRIATHCIVEHDGTILQCFSSKYMAYHLGVGLKGNKVPGKYKKDPFWYDKHSIGIEIDSWGPLTQKDGKFFSWTGKEVLSENVVYYPKGYRGQLFYERYTADQIETVRQLLLWFHERYEIPLDFNYDIFDVCNRALDKVPGIYSHTSYRSDKTDVHPQQELCEMLEGLS